MEVASNATLTRLLAHTPAPLATQSQTIVEILKTLDLPQDWRLAAATAPLLTARAIKPETIAAIAGVGVRELAAQIAALPEPNLAAIEALHTADPAQGENLRRLFLALIRDIRIVPLVLARPLARLMLLEDNCDAERKALAHEVFLLYAPLANRLGVWQLKWQLEDLAFRAAEPEHYAAIAAALAERRAAREARLAAARNRLEQLLIEAGIKARLSGRPKHIYSISRKMQRKDVALEDLYDLLGLRIIVADIPACYAALGVVHGNWRHIPHEFDDYIAAPKGNFYRSLHTAVIDGNGQALEIQIRTEAMHQESELGIAAHWRYKEGTTHDPALEERIGWLRRLLNEDSADASGLAPGITTELGSERVYVLTPRGRIIDLTPGATPLDFAYAVHTQLGHRTIGARVNGLIVPLTRPLSTGDIIEILTRTELHPSPDWLRPEAGYIVTRRARRKLRAWFHQSSAPTVSEPPGTVPGKPAPVRRKRKPAAGKLATPIVAGMPELAIESARCCHPRSGERIAALLTRSRGIRVHRADCTSFRISAARRPDQVLEAHWSDEGIDLNLRLEDRPGLIAELTTYLSRNGVTIRQMTASSQAGTARLRLNLTAPGRRGIDTLLATLTHLPGVQEVRFGYDDTHE